MHIVVNGIIGAVIGAVLTGIAIFFKNGKKKQAEFDKKWNEMQKEKK